MNKDENDKKIGDPGPPDNLDLSELFGESGYLNDIYGGGVSSSAKLTSLAFWKKSEDEKKCYSHQVNDFIQNGWPIKYKSLEDAIDRGRFESIFLDAYNMTWDEILGAIESVGDFSGSVIMRFGNSAKIIKAALVVLSNMFSDVSIDTYPWGESIVKASNIQSKRIVTGGSTDHKISETDAHNATISVMDFLESNDQDSWGGGVKPLIIDTLNLVHHMVQKDDITEKIIIESITKATKVLKPHYKSLIFVLKDRELHPTEQETRIAFNKLADKLKIQIHLVEQYDQEETKKHSEKARDDYYAVLLANEYRAPILTADQYRDIDQWSKAIKPFHVYEMNGDLPTIRHIVPQNLKPAILIMPEKYFR